MVRLLRPSYLLGGFYLLILGAAFAEHSYQPDAVLTVTTTADSGPGSLRNTLAAANNGDTIQFDAALNGQTITLTSGELIIDKNITINGPGPNLLSVARNSVTSFRIFHLKRNHTATMAGLTIRNGTTDGSGILNDHSDLTVDNCIIRDGDTGSASGLGQGGGIYNDGSSGSATLVITNSLISGNFASGYGGGIYNSGNVSLSLSNRRVNNNGAYYSDPSQPYGAGGGIYSDNASSNVTIINSIVNDNYAGSSSGPPVSSGYGGAIPELGGLTITNSSISGNTAGIGGGGIMNWGNGTITSSTIDNNSAFTFQGGQSYGGGIDNVGTLIVSNSTISGNSSITYGGGVDNVGMVTIANSTLSGNTTTQFGGGISNGSNTASVQLRNTILQRGTSGANIYNNGGTVTSQGYNLSSDNGGGFLTATGDQINANSMLGPLQDNGGPTFTHTLLFGSAAIDAGDPNFTPPPSTDQRGFARAVNGRIDIGSFETQSPPSPTPTATATPTVPPTPTATATATATVAATPSATAAASATATVPTSTPTPTPPYFRILWEGFDAVTPPALPTGWTTSFTSGPADCTPSGICGLGSHWVTAAGNFKTAPNAAFHDAPGCVIDSNLDTPSIFIPNVINPVAIHFWHSYNLESNHDGGVLEISIEGAPFTDIVTAGGFFLDQGYNGTISSAFLSPIADRQAWTGDSGGYVNVAANLPNAAKGHNVILRFRLATDCAVAGTGWYIDSIDINRYADPTPTATATAFGVTISGNVSYCSNPIPGPVAGVTLTLTPGGLTRITDSSGNYSFTVGSNGNYTVTPTKAARTPGSSGINTTDVIAVQRHFLTLGTPLSGCPLAAGNVNGDGSINTVDVIAIQRFFLGLSTGISNVGKYQFNPTSRSYTQPTSNQTNQNYDTLVFGDVVTPFVE